jgi:hypothetical protein
MTIQSIIHNPITNIELSEKAKKFAESITDINGYIYIAKQEHFTKQSLYVWNMLLHCTHVNNLIILKTIFYDTYSKKGTDTLVSFLNNIIREILVSIIPKEKHLLVEWHLLKIN